MNGLDFDIRVLQPWVRDPAFYLSVWTEQSDTPAHEGPAHHALVELWTYEFPLVPAAEKKLTLELRTIPPLLEQARLNLTGNARDLWLTGTGTMQEQVGNLEKLAKQTSGAGEELQRAIRSATQATQEFVTWLEQQAPAKTGPSGVGKEAYNWSLQNVHLIPLTWDQEVMLLERELARAHASLKLEEERNRGLPELRADASAEEHAKHANDAISKYMAFLKSRNIFEVEDYLEPALRAHIDPYVADRNPQFFLDRKSLRADDPVCTLPALVRPRMDEACAAPEPDPA